MNFLKGFILASPFFFLTAIGNAQGVDSSHHVPVNKNLSAAWKASLWQKDQLPFKGADLKTIGMPCGGVASGQLYVRGDGTLAGWWIANNAYNTGYGKDSLMNFQTAVGPWKVCYQTFEPLSYIDQGFAIGVKQGDKNITRELSKRDFDDISFVGEYPIASITYASKSRPLPVRVNMQVFSPFIPMNAQESATPGTILRFTVTNTASDDVDVTLTGWLQNLVCIDLRDSIRATLNNEVKSGPSFKSVCMSIDPGNNTALKNHPYYGNISLTVLDNGGHATADYVNGKSGPQISFAHRKPGDKLIGAVDGSIHLKRGETKEMTFLLTWFFPNRPSYFKGSDLTAILPNDWNQALPTKDVTILGNMYANWYSSSTDVAHFLQTNLKRLSSQTQLFHDTYYKQTTLPHWLVSRLLMPVSTLATETCQWWASDKFWAWEGVGSCVGTCTHVWNYEQALAHLFPELERNVREKTDFDVSFQADGSVLARDGWGDVLIDGHAGSILKAYREYLYSDNELFLSRNWDHIKRATKFLIAQDENNDGLIERTQANTYDIAFYGANTYVGGLYLAALKAAARMAIIMHDNTFADTCTRIFTSGEKNSVDRLWNGEYFRQDVDLVKHPRFQYANGCLSDQLFGQTWAHVLDLGYIYPSDKVHTALKSIWKYNWALDVGVQNRVHPPERVYANYGEAGLLVCTWPKGQHMGENGVRYRDEVWTGQEYQVAANMIYDGMTEEGLSIVKGLDERYSPAKHNPWNEIECGDHYARAMASWTVLLALENFRYNGPERMLGFSPAVQQDNFKSFFTADKSWGTISQKRDRAIQQNYIRVVYGSLKLKRIELDLVKKSENVTVTYDRKRISVTTHYSGSTVVVEFAELDVKEGGEICVTSN